MSGFVWIIPILAVCALCFAAYKASYVSHAAPGNTRMQEIASAIAEGADAFLMSEYKILAIFIVALFVLIGLFINWGTSLCFLLGALCSILAGFFGMNAVFKIYLMRMEGWFDFVISPVGFAKMFAFVFVAYLIVMAIDYRRIKKIPMDEALKHVD